MKIMDNKKRREELFDAFLSEEQDLSYDWFTDYYQTEHGDRDKLKQDFTPKCISQIISGMNGNVDNLADICAGTGGLTIKAWTTNKEAFFHCEELAKRAIPVLLFNLSIRGITGEVVNGDILTGEIFAVYALKNDGRYSIIEKVEKPEQRKYDSVIMNPPYSLPWSGQSDARFEKYGAPPKSKADYAFVLHGLNIMKETGRLLAVLPHGVLFRGQKEGIIRTNLVNAGMISTIVGLPDNLFLNTQIPTCIMELKKTQDGIYFVDASKEFEKGKSQNNMTEKHVAAVLNAYAMRRNIEKFSHLAKTEEIAQNGFNLNIPRYVDTFEPEEVRDLREVIKEMLELEKEAEKAENEFLTLMKQLVGTNEKADEKIRAATELFQKYIEGKNGQMEMDL